MKKLTTLIAILLCLSLLLMSCEEKLVTYTSDAGLSIDMPAGMSESSDNVNFTYVLEGMRVIFMATKEMKFDLAGYADDLESYKALLEQANGTTYEFKTVDNVTYFTYDATTDREYFYLAAIFEGSDAFWLCNFACVKTEQETYESRFIEWAKSIKVN